MASGIYWDLSPMCLSHLWLKKSSPWPWTYGIMSAGRFGQISLFLPLYAMLELPYLHGARNLARKKMAHIVAYDQGLNALEFRICSSGSSGVIQLLVRSTIPPFAPHVAFCPVRVIIPSVNSKQPA